MNNLEPCPFCGNDEPEAVEQENSHYIVCYECGLEAPLHPSLAEAVEAWNRRAGQKMVTVTRRSPPMPKPAYSVAVFEPWIALGKVLHGRNRRVDAFSRKQIEERDAQWLAMLTTSGSST